MTYPHSEDDDYDGTARDDYGRPFSTSPAKHFLCDHYCSDVLDSNQIRRDLEHWEWVAGDAERFPNADLEFIEQFSLAALDYLALECGKLA